jgi:hypothetical protein
MARRLVVNVKLDFGWAFVVGPPPRPLLKGLKRHTRKSLVVVPRRERERESAAAHIQPVIIPPTARSGRGVGVGVKLFFLFFFMRANDEL